MPFAAARRSTESQPPWTKPASETDRTLRDLRGVGPHIEEDLRSLGVDSVAALATRDGAKLYDALCRKTGVRQDPCVLDTFRCAVAQARDPRLPVEQANWWWWSRQRKAGRL
jgi:Pathogenicity locus